MKNALQLLHERNAAPKLESPGPDAAALENMFRAALRAPDHAWLQPWRFLVVEGESRVALGRVFRRSLLAEDSAADAAALDKAAAAPLRAPLVVVVVCRYTDHPKVPEFEQLLSAGCAAHAMLLAAEAQGYAGIWRTGRYAEDIRVARDLGLQDNEHIIGFLYFGTRQGSPKSLPEREVENYVSYWKP